MSDSRNYATRVIHWDKNFHSENYFHTKQVFKYIYIFFFFKYVCHLNIFRFIFSPRIKNKAVISLTAIRVSVCLPVESYRLNGTEWYFNGKFLAMFRT